jgi:hypothetical protein
VRYPLSPPSGDAGFFHRATFDVPAGGALVLELISPRPFRVWAARGIVADEPLFWRSFQREVRAAVIVPVDRPGPLALTFEFGPRPDVPDFVTDDCPSRNREKVFTDCGRVFPT